ncbi:MAG: DinB family protein [Bacteroidota bacterium]|nr:DinB family protein [Bacteroidota bacterium]
MKNFTKTILALTLIIFASANLIVTGDSAVEESMKEGFVADWERAKAYSLEYIDAMPEDGITFRPTEGVRTFAEQFLHMAQGNIGIVANATGAERIYATVNLEKESKYHNKKALRDITVEAYNWCIAAVKNMDMTKGEEKVESFGFNISRVEWLKKAFEHQTHHRGQTTVYLRMKGVTPPPEKLF